MVLDFVQEHHVHGEVIELILVNVRERAYVEFNDLEQELAVHSVSDEFAEKDFGFAVARVEIQQIFALAHILSNDIHHTLLLK